MSASEVLQTIKLLCNREIDPDNQSDILGSNSTSINSDIINSIIDYNNFKDKWIYNENINNIKISTILSNLRFKKNGGSWTNTPISEYSREDIINFSRILNTELIKTNENGTFKSLLDLLNVIRMTYNILEDNVFINFKAILTSNESKLSIGVPLYELDENNKYIMLTEKDDIKKRIENIIPNISKLSYNTSNIDVIRRILHGYELILHCYISNILLTIPNIPDDSLNILRNINNQMIRKIKLYNDTVLQEGNSNINKLNELLRKNEKLYNQRSEGLEILNDEINKLQSDITIGNKNLNQNKSNVNYQRVLYFSILILFIISISVLILVRDNNETLRNISIPLLIISILSIIMLHTTNKVKIVEPFNSALDIPSIIESNNAIILESFNKYLIHTLYISLLIKSYNHYGNTNDSINKEYNYYNSQKLRYRNINHTLKDNNAISYLDNKIYEYRSYMFNILNIIIVSSILIYSSIENQKLKDIIIWIMILLILFVIFAYIILINNIVRTEPRKLYWYQPKI